jgi:hypothetical protein
VSCQQHSQALRKGILTSRRATRLSLPSIDRGEVGPWLIGDRERATCGHPGLGARINAFDHRPDQDHESLSTRQVAMLLGIGQAALRARVEHPIPAKRGMGRRLGE